MEHLALNTDFLLSLKKIQVTGHIFQLKFGTKACGGHILP